MSALSSYDDALVNHPARGAGLHQFLMTIANLGLLAELPQDVIIRDMYAIDRIKRNEPEDAVKKAVMKFNKEYDYKPRPISRFAPKVENALEKLINGVSEDLMDLIESSPIQLLDSTDRDATTLLNVLYEPSDMLFIGDVFGKSVKSVSDWMKEDLQKYPHIIPNPMTGKAGLTETAKISYRCESTLADLRYAVCEMDEVPLDKQTAFWIKCISLGVPVSAVIHSGSKSLHGWVKVNCGMDTDKWEKDVKGWLFNEFGKMYGLDKACSNKARLSRLPGFYREGKEQQRLLYLNGDV